jgi:uncharacterized protein
MREIRTFELRGARVEQRADNGSTVEGYAAVFNADSVDLGFFDTFVERIAPGAFKRSIAGGDPILALWNHNSDLVLGSTRSGKLELSEDSEGLHFRLDGGRLTPAQLDAIADGDMRMSFGFETRKDQWEHRDDGSVIRTLIDVDLHEISPVAFPAYPDTSVALRSLDAWRAEQPPTRSRAAALAAARCRMAAELRARTSRA